MPWTTRALWGWLQTGLRLKPHKQQVFLRFRDEFGYGSHEHYYHFAIGYLFPALALILRQEQGNPVRSIFVFEDCGPKLSPLITEAGELLGIPTRVLDRHEQPPTAKTLDVPRWDVDALATAFVSPPASAPQEFLDVQKGVAATLPEAIEQLRAPDHPRKCQEDFTRFRDTMWDAVGPSPAPVHGKVLVLQREPPPKFYHPAGQARIKTYGTDRRSLQNVEEIAESLRAAGMDATGFAPGTHSLAEQIRAFRDCAGVVMIRGAEIANACFMKAGTPLIVLSPAEFANYPAPHKALAPLLGLQLTETIVPDLHFRADPAAIVKDLQTLNKGLPASAIG